MMNKQVTSSFMLCLTALIWGAAFVAQSVGMDYVGPFTFNAVRSILGGIILIPVIFLLRKQKGNQKVVESKTPKNKKTLILGGVCCGTVLALASSMQQIGLSYTSVGKAGFITVLYIVMVPICGIFFKKKVGFKVWISVLLALTGMYFLSITDGLTVEKGDLLMLLSALLFTVHILVIDYFSPLVDGVTMSSIQFFCCGILSGIAMFITETPQISAIKEASVPILYAGIMSCGVAYTLQIVAQKNVKPVLASLIMSMESVFAALCGWLILGESLSQREILGCVFVFTAIILAQIPAFSRKLQPTAFDVKKNSQADTL